MAPKPSYGWAFVSTFTGAVVAVVVMAIPSWLWADYVLDVKFNSIVGRAEELGTWDRILLYAGNLLIVFAGYSVYTWAARSLYNTFAGVELRWWDVFFALISTGIVAGVVGYFFPFLGLLIVVFLTPAVLNSWSEWPGGIPAEDRPMREQPETSLRPG